MKIHILPPPKQFQVLWSCPRTDLLIKEGLQKIDDVQLVNNISDAQFIFYSYVPQSNKTKYDFSDINQLPKEKLVCIDNTDECDKFYLDNPNDCFAYFKRSFPLTNKLMKFDRFEKVYPFTYGILDGFLPQQTNLHEERKIDFGCYLRNSCENRAKVRSFASGMKMILSMDKSILSLGNYLVGEISSGSRSNGNEVCFDPLYFQTLNDTRLLLTCQPTHWHGDSRLWESLANSCLTFTDRDSIDIPHKLVDEEHLIYYDINNLSELRRKIQYYLEHEDEAEEIANAGQKYAITWHSSHARMKYVVEQIKLLKDLEGEK